MTDGTLPDERVIAQGFGVGGLRFSGAGIVDDWGASAQSAARNLVKSFICKKTFTSSKGHSRAVSPNLADFPRPLHGHISVLYIDMAG